MWKWWRRLEERVYGPDLFENARRLIEEARGEPLPPGTDIPSYQLGRADEQYRQAVRRHG